jgi:hypothetical protein
MTYLYMLLTVCGNFFKTFVFRAGRGSLTPPHVIHCLAQTFAPPVSLLVLFLLKHAWLLKVLLHSPHGILVPEKEHGDTEMQSLHAFSHLCVSPIWQPLPHPLHTYPFDIAYARLVITWWCLVTSSYNKFSRLSESTLPSNIMSSQFNTPYTTMLYSL